MSLRYYVCPVVTSLLNDEMTTRPDLPTGVDYVALYVPGVAWAIVMVDAVDHAPVEAVSNIIVLGLSPESPMSDVPQGQRNQFRTRLSQAGIEITIDYAVDLARDVFDRIALALQPTYRRGSGMSIRGQS